MKQTKPFVLILSGLPASGKSTWAIKEASQSGGQTKRISKDDLRRMFHTGQPFSKEREKFICSIRDAMILECISQGYNVIVDDTNLSPRHETRIREIVGDTATIDTKFFEIDVRMAIKRDLERQYSVGKDVILNMYQQFILPKEFPVLEQDTRLPKAYISDIDGTLAFSTHRSVYDYTQVITDEPNKAVVDMYKNIEAEGYTMIICSGRNEECREQTIEWLKLHGLRYDELHMRPANDNTKDMYVKRRMLEDILTRYQVLGVIDDRKQVKRMWVASGIQVFDVNQKDEEF